MAIEYIGSDILYLLSIPKTDGSGDTYERFFNQTDGNTSIDADDVELETKDKNETAYGKVSQTVSFGGIMTEGDEAFKALKVALRQKKYVSLVEFDRRTMEGEQGVYKLNSFEKDSGVGDNVALSIEATLSGEVTNVTLTEIPDGAPPNEADGTP